jgi:15-cis-phytoene synthase
MTTDALPLPLSPTVEEAYTFCRTITHRYGANFSVGFRFLPAPKRRAVYAAYAWCRWADDIADEGDEATSAERMRQLDSWQRELDSCYAGHPSHPITIALADTLRAFAIPKTAFVALIDGCRQDMVKTRYETFEELLGYCDLVASSISDISLAIFGYKTDAALDYGRNLSTALQLTNVTRDIGEDVGRDRIYVPGQELERFGVSEVELVSLHPTDNLRRLIEFQIERAEGYFRRAEPLIAELSFDARFPTLLMGGVYATVLQRLRANPLVVLHHRMRLTRLEKLSVIARRLVRPHFI